MKYEVGNLIFSFQPSAYPYPSQKADANGIALATAFITFRYNVLS